MHYSSAECIGDLAVVPCIRNVFPVAQLYLFLWQLFYNKTSLTKIGLAFSHQKVENVPTEKIDKK